MKFNKDSIGIVFSALCGVHCLLMPVLFLLPFASEYLGHFHHLHHNHEVIHVVLYVIVLPLALTVVNKALKLKMNILLFTASFGIVLLSLSVLNNFVHFFEHESIGEVLLALVGSLFLVWSHFKSLRSCHSA